MTATATPQTPTEGTTAPAPAAPAAPAPVAKAPAASAADAPPQEKQTATPPELKGLSTDPPKPASARPGSPEKFDWKIEGDPSFVSTITGKFEPVARGLGLSNEEAHGVYGAFADVMRENVKQLHTKWAGDLQKDKDIGGEKLEESLGLAKSIVDKYGDDEFRGLLNQGGLRYNPALIKMLVKMAKDVGGDRLPRVSDRPAGRDSLDDMYPTMKK